MGLSNGNTAGKIMITEAIARETMLFSRVQGGAQLVGQRAIEIFGPGLRLGAATAVQAANGHMARPLTRDDPAHESIKGEYLSRINISETTRLRRISLAVFCLTT